MRKDSILTHNVRSYILDIINDGRNSLTPLKFSSFHNEVQQLVDRKLTVLEKRAITRHIVTISKITKDIQLVYHAGASSKQKRSVGIEFIKIYKPVEPEKDAVPDVTLQKPDSQEPDSAAAPLQNDDKLDYEIIGRAMDRYIQELKKEIGFLSIKLEDEQKKHRKIENDLRATLSISQNDIKKLNEQVTILNDTIERLKGKRKQTGTSSITLGEMARLKQ